MEKEGTADPLKASKQFRKEICDFEAKIDKLKQRLKLLLSEEKSELDEKNEQILVNQMMIEELKTNIDYYKLQLKKGKLGDERILKKAFRKHNSEIGLMKGKSAEDVIEILEDRVFDLTKKKDVLQYQLGKTQETFHKLKKELRELERDCSKFHSGNRSAQEARETENDFQETQMQISELQKIQNIFKDMQCSLEEDLRNLPRKVDDLQEQYDMQQIEIEALKKREYKAVKAREKAKKKLAKSEIKALQAKQEKEKVMTEFNQVLDHKYFQMSDSDTAESTLLEQEKLEKEKEMNKMNEIKQKQESELAIFKCDFEKIKKATGVSDIEDAEKRIESQNAISENLHQLRSRSEAMLEKLKQEKQDLESKMEAMLGADLATAKNTLNKKIAKYQKLCEEGRKSKLAAEIECERVHNLVVQTKTSLWHISQIMEYHGTKVSTEAPEMPEDIAGKIQEMINEIQKKLEGHVVNELLEKMKEEQAFLKKLEDESLLEPIQHRKKGKPQAEIESSSEEEEVGKRNELKKASQAFADMKQKQKGKGEAFQL